ncbi:hypothetical protein AB0M02_45785 [Actinoplanes sp. NPDC051861]|uniref:hypothetical protein n=1 Tax=Actinoplanes sp. NPDC051861 TaxID=3155170 RepID=UPI003446EA90
MFSSRKNRAERTASQAWEHLSAAMATAGEAGKHTAGSATGAASDLAGRASRKSRKLADRAGDRVSYVTDEALFRANAAANALAGRKPRRPWGLIAGVGLIGLAIGWAVAGTARAALERQAEEEQLELAETAIVVTPTYDET